LNCVQHNTLKLSETIKVMKKYTLLVGWEVRMVRNTSEAVNMQNTNDVGKDKMSIVSSVGQ